MFKIITSYAFRNLMRTRLRTFFTLFSVALIILLYSVLTSVGSSFSEQISNVLGDQNIDIAVQAKHATNPSTSIIDEHIFKEISSLDGVKAVHSLLIGNRRLQGDKLVVILGVSNFNTFAQRLGFALSKGRAIVSGAKELVIGEKAAKVYGLDVGDQIGFGDDQQYSIVGIYSSWLSFLNSGLISDLESVQSLISRPGKASLLFVQLENSSDTPKMTEKINRQFPDMNAIQSQQLPDHLGPIKSVFYFTDIVSVMTLFIAGAVLLNTFIMAISERTKELGVLSAIGWPRQMIVMVFFVESLILSLTGSILGYFASFGVFPILQNHFSSVVMFLPNAPTLPVFFNVLLMSVVIGLLSTLFPALYGTNIQVSKAIRHE